MQLKYVQATTHPSHAELMVMLLTNSGFTLATHWSKPNKQSYHHKYINSETVRETSSCVHRTLNLQKQPDAAVWNTLQLPICYPSLMKGFWQWLTHTHIHSETDKSLGSNNKKTFETREHLHIKCVKCIQMCTENPWNILLLSMFSAHAKHIHSHNSARPGVS